MYFTYVHIIFIILILLLFAAVGFLVIRRLDSAKNILIAIISFFFASIGTCVLVCLVLDDSLKTAKITGEQYTRVLVSESLQFSGIITNTGNFDIMGCKLKVRLGNKVTKAANLRPEFFEQRGGFWENFFKRNKQFEISVVKQDFTIGQDLAAKSARPFSVFIRFPTTFADPKVTYTLSCW